MSWSLGRAGDSLRSHLGGGRHIEVDRLAFDEIDRLAADRAHHVVFADALGHRRAAVNPSDGSQPMATAIGISDEPPFCQAVT